MADKQFRFSVDTYEHVLGHISKAAGKLHGLAGDVDHIRELNPTLSVEDAAKRAEVLNGKAASCYIADLVICARELAKLCPAGAFDIEQAVARRMGEKRTYLEQYSDG